MNKKLTAILAAAIAVSPIVEAKSFGRSGGGFRSSPSHSVSAPSRSPSPPSTTSNTNVQKSTPGGIGGASGSLGVKKSDVTQNRNTPTNTSVPPQNTRYNSGSTYGQPPIQSPSPQISTGSVFMSSLGGSLVGSALGNMLFGNHGGGSTTVINNGSGGGAAPSSTGVSSESGGNFTQYGSPVPQKSYGLFDFLIDVFLFTILVGFIVMLAYFGKKMFDYFKKRKTVNQALKTTKPLDISGTFWNVQKAFAEADIASLKSMVGPSMMAELSDIEPTHVSIDRLSYEVIHSKDLEMSVEYEFVDTTDGVMNVEQVWHFEVIDGSWKVVGIENV